MYHTTRKNPDRVRKKQDPTQRKKEKKRADFASNKGKTYAKRMTAGELISALVADLGLQEAKSMYPTEGSFRSPIFIDGHGKLCKLTWGGTVHVT